MKHEIFGKYTPYLRLAAAERTLVGAAGGQFRGTAKVSDVSNLQGGENERPTKALWGVILKFHWYRQSGL